MTTIIRDAESLQACVGKLPGPRDLKVIDFIDAHAQRWIGSAPFAFFAFARGDALTISAAGGARGFVCVVDPHTLRLPRAALDRDADAQAGASFGSLFLSPGLGETLRVNGRVAAVDAETVTLVVAECYLHCAKALMRSAFWDSAPLDDAPTDSRALLAASRFMALATVDDQGRVDVSPKGDPAGALLQWHDGSAWYADRPGNRRVDSFRNILTQPRVAALALLPGATTLLTLHGRASIISDAPLASAFAVDGRVPRLVTQIDDLRLATAESAALRCARLWPAAPADEQLDPAATFAAHVKLSKTRGLAAGIARAALSVPGLMDKGLQHDYKNNLY
ncbi:pyridoxamine 5'-phosphate oxidase family protein [Solimonas soli]|uniref:pyridoxamine 5'-phosphate oxidase family protein n=1 Tax=Solimonas soli TaxID=413479 RepID=UPI0004844122|nr:pyridoxamine 5'-phosphate oxidase family protein [Solimonas soli]